MKNILILISFLLIVNIAYSQTVLMEENVKHDTIPPKWGKNLKHYGNFYIGYGFFADPSNKGAKIKYGNSGEMLVGFRYKYKICNYYALGADLGLGFISYNLKDDEEKVLPDIVNHDKEKINFSNLKLQVYQRINFDRRGNSLGKYLDLGAYGGWNFGTKHYFKDKPDGTSFNIIEVTEKRLDYIEDLSYGIITRVGSNNWSVFAIYRLSDLFKKTELIPVKYPELPKLVIGVEIGF